jgi:glycosyltransferase involved in cell wall biosynthesis
MRIAFVSDSVYPWNFGGLETLERAEADALAKEHELHFFSLKWPGMQNEFRKDGIQYHAFHEVNTTKFYRHGRRSIREALAYTAGLLRIFKYRFDVIQTNEFPILHLPLLKVYCILTGCKLVVDVHEVWDLDYWTTYLGHYKGSAAEIYANIALGLADHYVANSKATAEKLRRMEIPNSQITVFAPTIDDRKMARIKAKEAREIVFAGRLIKEKRLDKWLEVVAKVSKVTKVKGLIVGEGPDAGQIKAQIKRLKLEKVVQLRGFYSGKEQSVLFSRIKGASLFLHMSEREGLSTVALESIALGTPVLLPSYTPIPSDVRDMCVVADEKDLPKVAARIINGEKDSFIPNRERVMQFYTSRVGAVYSEIFRKLGL